MVDPLSIAASVLTVITAAVQSTKSLYETVKHFKERDKTLRRLQDELEDLANILESLTQVANAEMAMLALLQVPVDRWSQLCQILFPNPNSASTRDSYTGSRLSGYSVVPLIRHRLGSLVSIEPLQRL
ncbi:hypothetical protein RJ035_000158 [Blastomyces gilchristii]